MNSKTLFVVALVLVAIGGIIGYSTMSSGQFMTASIGGVVGIFGKIPSQLATLVGTSVEVQSAICYDFRDNLKMGDSSADVQKLQRFLASRPTESGWTSLTFTNYFGAYTAMSLRTYQESHKAEILTPQGLTSGNGILDVKTRTYIKSVTCGENSIASSASTASSGVPTLGDLDKNGQVALADSVLLNRYLNNEVSLSDEQKRLADLDNNSVVDRVDYFLIRKVILEIIIVPELPVLFGDVDLDGKVGLTDMTIMSRTTFNPAAISRKARLQADVDLNGAVNILDMHLVRSKVIGRITLPLMWGDLNGDYLVKLADLVTLSRGIEANNLTPRQLKAGDVYYDGVVNTKDVQTLRSYIAGTITSLPAGL